MNREQERCARAQSWAKVALREFLDRCFENAARNLERQALELRTHIKRGGR